MPDATQDGAETHSSLPAWPPEDLRLRLQRLQHAFAQASGIALAALGEFDDIFSDQVCLRMIVVAQTKSATDVGAGRNQRGFLIWINAGRNPLPPSCNQR